MLNPNTSEQLAYLRLMVLVGREYSRKCKMIISYFLMPEISDHT